MFLCDVGMTKDNKTWSSDLNSRRLQLNFLLHHLLEYLVLFSTIFFSGYELHIVACGGIVRIYFEDFIDVGAARFVFSKFIGDRN